MYYKGIGHVQEAVIFKNNLSSFFKLMNLVFCHKNKETNILHSKTITNICVIVYALLLILSCFKLKDGNSVTAEKMIICTTSLYLSICVVY